MPMRRNAASLAAAVLASTLLLSRTALAQDEEEREPTPWDQGHISLAIVVSSQDSFGDSYFVVGGGAGFFVVDGLELGGRVVRWFGGDPGITELSPHVRYVAVPLGWPLLPYAGAFYTHYFIEDIFPDADTVGARLGMLYHQGGGLTVGVGAAYERFVSDCEDDCSTIYPEVSVGFSF